MTTEEQKAYNNGFVIGKASNGVVQVDGAGIITGQDEISGVLKTNIQAQNMVAIEKIITYSVIPSPISIISGSGNLSVAFSKDDTYFAATASVTPFVYLYKKIGDEFIRLPNPDVLPAGQGMSVDFSSDGNHLAIAMSGAPYIIIYKIVGDTFTKIDNPDVVPTGFVMRAKYSGNGNYLGLAIEQSPYMIIYRRNGDTYTKLPTPTSPPSQGWGIALSPNGEYVAFHGNTSPYVYFYKIVGDVITRCATPTTIPNQSHSYYCDFSPDGKYVVTTIAVAPGFFVYKIGTTQNGETIFTKIPDPPAYSLWTPSVHCAKFTPDGDYIVAGVNDYYTFSGAGLIIHKKVNDIMTRIVIPPLDISGYSININEIAITSSNDMMVLSLSNSPFLKFLKGTITYKFSDVQNDTENVRLSDGIGYAKQSGIIDDKISIVRLLK